MPHSFVYVSGHNFDQHWAAVSESHRFLLLKNFIVSKRKNWCYQFTKTALPIQYLEEGEDDTTAANYQELSLLELYSVFENLIKSKEQLE